MRFAALAAMLVLASCGSSPKPAPAPAGRLNLVLVTIDTLRADRLGCYGYSKAETPHLDRLATNGALFENAVTQAPLTAPSHASMFTGLTPIQHGVRDTGGFVLDSRHTTLAEVLSQQGWDTAAFVGASVLKKSFGFTQGFAVYDDQMPKPAPGTGGSEFPERRAAEVVDRASQWLGGRGAGKPFFLWVHLFDPHGPYDPPSPFHEKHAGRPYDGEVAYTDQQLGRLLERIPANTLIAVVSDHGESLGDHGEFTHGVFLYDSTLRIAFLLSGPGVPKGVRVKQQARAMDLPRTLLELVSVAPPEAIQGTSLVPSLASRESAAADSYGETLYSKLNMGWAELRAIRSNRWKFIRAPKPELYDLRADPGETNNVIAAHPAEARELEARLGTAPEKVETSAVDAKTMAQLRSLGYLGGSSSGALTLTGTGIDPKDRIEVLRLLFGASADSGGPSAQRIPLLRKALQLDPANPAIYYQLGLEYTSAGDPAAALDLYRAGLRNGIKTAWLYSRMAGILLRQGQRGEAITWFEKAAQLNPADSESMSDLGLAYLESGKPADAERIFRWSLAAGGADFALTHNGLGLAAIEKQDLTAARGHFEKAISLDPNLLEAQLNLGRIYKIAGDRQRARERFEAFLAKASPAEYGELIPKIRAEVAELR